MDTKQERAMIQRFRRMADRQGLFLSRSRGRNPERYDYGKFMLADASTGNPIHGYFVDSPYALDLDEVEEWLSEIINPAKTEYVVVPETTAKMLNKTLILPTKIAAEAAADAFSGQYEVVAIQVPAHETKVKLKRTDSGWRVVDCSDHA